MADREQDSRQNLRRQAETRLHEQRLDRPPTNLQDAESLLQELLVQHIELEIQNQELRRGEQALAESYQNYYLLYDRAPIGYFVLDFSGTILFVNQAGAELVGYPAARLEGTRFELLLPSPQRDTFYLHRQQVIESKEQQQTELSLLVEDGSLRYVVIKSGLRPPAEENDKPRLLVAVLDRTELHHLEDVYQILVDQSLQGLAIFQNGRLVFANPALANITGYTVAELMAMNRAGLDRLIHPEDLARFWQVARAYMAGQTISPDQEVRLIHRSGQTRWLEGHSVLIEHKGQAAIQTSVLDITRRKVTELALEQTQRVIERITNAAPMIIYIYDLLEDRNVYINEQVESILGYTVEEFAAFQTNMVQDLIHPDDHPATRAYMQHLAATAQDARFYEHELRMRHAAGYWCWILARDVVFNRTLEGAPRQLLGTLLDITPRKEAEAERERLLAQSNQQREELRTLSARLSELREEERAAWSRELHDRIGQNLTALGFNLAYVRDKLSKDSALATGDRLTDSLVLLEETTDSIRDLMAELRPPMMEEEGLLDSLEWYIQQYSTRLDVQVQLEDKTHRQRLAPAAEIGLFRIFQEALTNAARHARAGQVSVTLEQIEKSYRLTITDDGVGFTPQPPDELSAGHRRLGLLTMRERANAMGGQFWVDSEPGRGTKIIVEVPGL